MKQAGTRLISIIITLVMAIGMVPMMSQPVFAADPSSPTITVGTASGRPGTTVDIPISIANNSGIVSLNVSIAYDSSKLKLAGVTNGTVLSDPAHSGSLNTNPYKLSFAMDLSPVNITNNGVIATLSFEILTTTKEGDAGITVNYNSSDIYDIDYSNVYFEKVNGKIAVFNYIPGDVNGDGEVNAKDVTRLRRYLAGGWPAPDNTIDAMAANCNGDNEVNAKDITRLRRYLAGGWINDSTLPSTGATDPCVNGHTAVTDPAVAPTYDNTGLTEGSHCSVCNIVLVAQTVIPKLQRDEYTIVYHIDNNDAYLKSLDIINPNPSAYLKQSGLVLQDLIVEGYNFLGWFTSATGGTKVTDIVPQSTGNRTLYAQWGKIEYTVQFASDMVPVASITYKVGEEKVLPKPTLDKYTFIGWSDANGKLWSSITKGTTGNIILSANWASNRNKAVAKKQLSDPIIAEDSNSGLILFNYELGEIKNIPLFTTLNLNCANGIISTVSKTETEEISSTSAETIAQTISNATTNSSAWTLSSDWNNTTQISKTYLDQTTHTREEAETLAKSSSNTYNLSSSLGGSVGAANTAEGAYKLSANKSHSNTNTSETGESFDLSVDAKYSHESSFNWGLSAGVGFPIKAVDIGIGGNIGGGTKDTFELGVGADYGTYRKDTNTQTDAWSNSSEISGSRSATTMAEKNWNTTAGYSSSNSVSTSQTVSNAVSKLISEQRGYGESYSEGGSNSESKALASTDSKSDEFSTALTYYTSKIKSKTTTYSSTGNTVGDYRLVMAGTAHVFATVGYDVAKQTYFVYTYNVLDEATEEYLDYSYDGSFNDYETSILPFEVPIFVNDYVNAQIAKTEGLVIDPDTGIIEDYNPIGEPDEIVVIPAYISIDNHDGTFSSVKVKGISPRLFKNNTEITAVRLGKYITEIPDSAFAGCTSLKYISSPGVTKIGNNAFSGCTSLTKFSLSTDLTGLGTNAFEGVPEISAVASSANIAQAVALSGADKITLDISGIPKNESSNMEFNMGEIGFFELQGKDKEYKGLSIKSAAATTVINGVTFTENTKIPMELSSANVTLDRVTADSIGFALVLKASNTNVKLNRTVNLVSTNDNAVLAKNITLSPLTTGVVGKLNVSGNVLVCGAITGQNNLAVNGGEIIYITDEEFENYLSSHRVSFDANGGTVATENKLVVYNSEMGDLPIPSRDYYTFAGWFTAKKDGEPIDSKTIMTAITDITIYAHWTQNDVSAWTLAADLPEGAEVVSNKWTYTQRYETSSSSSTLSGWTQYDSSFVWGPWSPWSRTDPGSNSNRERDSHWTPTYKPQWHYYRWCGPSTGRYTYKLNSSYWAEETWFDYELPAYGNGYDTAIIKVNGSGWANVWFPAHISDSGNFTDRSWTRQVESGGYSEYRYRDKIWTYKFFRTEDLEASTKPSGSLISDVQEWVQFRALK